MIARQLTFFIFQLEDAPGTSQAYHSDCDQWSSNDQANEQVNDDCVIPWTGVEENVCERNQDGQD
jgi:hypothetical protein